MTKEQEIIQSIKNRAAEIHSGVNQKYDGHPYSHHLDMVGEIVLEVFREEVDYGLMEDMLPAVFGAWFHDSMEDARLTYNDVLKEARSLLGKSGKQAVMAAEIVYALTNEKGRNRAERASDKYYQGIRETPWAPLVKAADRLANMRYGKETESRMIEVYREELPGFLEKLVVHKPGDPRLQIPEGLLRSLMEV